MRKRVLWGTASAAVLCVIWGNSLLPGSLSSSLSSQASEGILSFIYRLIPYQSIDFYSFHSFIRKAAHFGEYAVLGICLYQFMKTYRIKKVLLYVFLICLCCACADELIQSFTLNRLAKLSDVFLDSIGSLCGLGLCHLIAGRRKIYAGHGCEKNAGG